MNLKLIRILTVFFFVFPYFFIFYSLNYSQISWSSELTWALFNSLEQSFTSAIGTLLLGILFSLGLISLPSKLRNFADIYLLVTSFVPSLFLVLSLMKLIVPYPMGLWGIVLVHVSSYFGFAAVLLARAIESKVGSMAETAFVLGSSKLFFLRKVLIPRLKFEILFVGLVIFQMCMTSFSVPLLVGGHQGTNLEILMFEKIRLNADWNLAAQIGLLQVFIVTGISFLIMGFKQRKFETLNRAQLLGSTWALCLGLGLQTLILIGYLLNLQNFNSSLTFILANGSQIFEYAAISAIQAVVTFFVLKFLFFIIAKSYYSRVYRIFLKNFIQPSVVLSSFSFLLIGSNQGLFIYIKIILVFVLLNGLGLFKIGLQTMLDDLEAQRAVAGTLGASEDMIFRKIVYPQIYLQLNQYALLGSVLIVGDFSVGRILALKDLTLAMFMQTLMAGYRLEIATWISLILVFITVVSYFISKEIGNVCYKKFKI